MCYKIYDNMPTLISNRKNYIFIHIPKCAGTSIAKYLNKYDNDSISIKLFNYITRRFGSKKNIFFHGPFLSFFNPKFINDHETAYNLKKIIGEKEFERYFKFCFVRNPWARSLSRYNYYIYHSKSKITFKEFLNKDFQPQLKRISDNSGNILVDFIGSFENFDKDFQKILNIIKIDYKKENLMHINKTKFIDDYKKYYDEECFQIVDKKYAEDIKYFDYKF